MKRFLFLAIASVMLSGCEEYITYDTMTNEFSEVLPPGDSHVFDLVGEYDKVATSGTIVLSLQSSKLSGDLGSTDYSYDIENPSGLVYSRTGMSFSGTSTYVSPHDLPAYMLDGQSTKGTWKFTFYNDDPTYTITVDYVEVTVLF